LSIEELLARPDQFVGVEMSLNTGLFVGDESFIAPNYEAYLATDRIRISDNGIIKQRLSNELSPYGGGAVMYAEKVSISGALNRNKGELEFIPIGECIVSRDANHVIISFDADNKT